MAPPTGEISCGLLAYLAADDKSNSGLLDIAASVHIKRICEAAHQLNIPFAIQVDFKHDLLGWFRFSAFKPDQSGSVGEQSSQQKLILKLLNGWLRRWLPDDVRVTCEQVDSNVASKQTLVDFLRFARTACPADRHVLLFFGHSYGPMGMFRDTDLGDVVPKVLRINELGEAVRSVEPVDIILFHDCFMGNLETVYELRNGAKYIIASQAEVPIHGGWPWADLMTSMKAPDLRDAALGCTERMRKYFANPKNRTSSRGTFADVPWSLLGVDAVNEIVEPFLALTGSLSGAWTNESLRKTYAPKLEDARIGGSDDHTDPGDRALIDVTKMCAELQQLHGDIASHAEQVNRVLRNIICLPFDADQKFGGVSLYYSTEEATHTGTQDPSCDVVYYRNLGFCTATQWSDIALRPL